MCRTVSDYAKRLMDGSADNLTRPKSTGMRFALCVDLRYIFLGEENARCFRKTIKTARSKPPKRA